MKIYYILIIAVFMSIFLIEGCDSLFSTNPKSPVPSDHTNNLGGAYHKGNNRENMTPDECNDCHTTDLRGKVSLINGVYTWANSCYQCHGAVWERGGGNNKSTY